MRLTHLILLSFAAVFLTSCSKNQPEQTAGHTVGDDSVTVEHESTSHQAEQHAAGVDQVAEHGKQGSRPHQGGHRQAGHEQNGEHPTASEAPTSGLTVHDLSLPAAKGSRYPFVTKGGDGKMYVCWLEPGPAKTFRLRFSVYENAEFRKPRTIAQGTDWFINWADFPSIAALADGTLAAHWLARNGKGTYAYGIRIATSTDGGQSWSAPFWLHDDRSSTEHGFVSMLPQSDGHFLAIWLDGRDMKSTGNTQLWTRRFDARGTLSEELRLDERVCSCCQTSMAQIGSRVLAVYRDRDSDEIRDISKVGWDGKRWSQPREVHVDRWKIPG